MTARPAGTTICPKCDSWWGGLNTAHCAACCRTFSGIAAFDRHRAGSHSQSTRHCVDPETVLTKTGERVLELTNRNYPCWALAGSWTGPKDAA